MLSWQIPWFHKLTPHSYHISFLTIPPHLQLISSSTTRPKCTLRSVLFTIGQVFFHCCHKMKCSCYQDSSVIRSWIVYLFVFFFFCNQISPPRAAHFAVNYLKAGPKKGTIKISPNKKKSDFGWHRFRFHLAWCVRGLQSLKRYWLYLITFRSCISNGKPE